MEEVKKVNHCPKSVLELLKNISQVIIESKKKVVISVNTTLLDAYWNIGKLIVPVNAGTEPLEHTDIDDGCHHAPKQIGNDAFVFIP